ncbi:hypothetical protein RDWZM_010321 [Blomia tropicalis]|uniref:BTB domain-containing protein n=1 Tax=Blomia tropicalis TaxID=40697 RepID=A0A9Q0LZ14_BLOTA|nr:hypothetical protein RDWZM_010321 [Blomia tropicalis]
MNESPPRTPPPPTTSPPEVAATATPTPTSPPSQASPSIVQLSTPELNNNIVRYETIHSKMDNLSSSSSSPELIHKSPRSLYSLFGDAKRRMLLINNNNHQQDLSIDSSFDEEDDDDEEEEVDEEEDEEEDDDEIVEERNDIHRNGEEKNVNEQNQWKMDENGKRIAKSTTITDTSRCNYVNVIVNCSNRLSSNGKSNRTTKMVDQVTLTIERLVDDPHLRKAWKRCQFIDLFLYSTCSTTIINDNNVEDDHHQSIRIWPAHRIVVCAHSSHVKQFFHSYPDVEMLTKQIDSFIKLNEEDNKEQEEEEEEDDDDDEIIDVVNSEHNRIDLLKLQSMEETKRKLSNSTIPVLMINVPAIDLRDLLRLMYFGQIVVNRNRLNSLHQSANQLKMNSINIVEMNKLLSDLSNVEPKNEINKTSQTVITDTKMIKEMNKRNENEIELVAECSNKSIESSKLISNTTSTATFFPFMRSYSLDQLEQRNQPSIFMNNNQQMKRKEPSMDLEKLYEDILQQRLNECLEIEKQKNKKIHNNKPTSTCTNDLLLPMNPIEVPQRKGPFLDIPSFGPLSSDLSASMSPLSTFIRANPFEHAFNPFAVSMLNNHHQHQQTNCSPQLIPPSFGGRLLPQYQQSPPQSPLIPTPQYQRQTSAPANLTPFTNKPTPTTKSIDL